MNSKLNHLLYEWGIPPHIKGYRYIVTAVEIIQEDPEALDMLTKKLYPGIAKRHNTDRTRVERAIRHAKLVGLDHMDADQLYKYFGRTIGMDGKVTNGMYLAVLAQTFKEM